MSYHISTHIKCCICIALVSQLCGKYFIVPTFSSRRTALPYSSALLNGNEISGTFKSCLE